MMQLFVIVRLPQEFHLYYLLSVAYVIYIIHFCIVEFLYVFIAIRDMKANAVFNLIFANYWTRYSLYASELSKANTVFKVVFSSNFLIKKSTSHLTKSGQSDWVIRV